MSSCISTPPASPDAREDTHTYCLGGLDFFMFLILTVTGVLLMFYYVPSTERAYTDVAALETNVAFGMLMRNLHRWTAHGW